jgi:hypothetical protein
MGLAKQCISPINLIEGSRRLDAHLSPAGPVRACTVTTDNCVWTAYPFRDGIIHEIKLEVVDEWLNGIEAQIHCTLGDAAIAFFDTEYFKNKMAYRQGNSYKFSLSAFVYRLTRSEPQTFKDRDGRDITTKGMAALIPMNGGDVDDFIFSISVKEIAEL